MSTQRTKRVGEQIRKVVSEQLIRGLRDPVPGFVTICDVEVTRDFSRAKVFFSVIGTEAEAAEAKDVLNDNRGALRKLVGQAIRTRNTPELVFVLDESGARASRIHELLDEARTAPTAADDSEDGEKG